MQRKRSIPRRNAPVAPPVDVVLDARTRLAIRLGDALLRILGMTWRVRVFGRSALLDRTADSERVVYTLWHGEMLPIIWAHRQPTSVLISEHRDGEIIARILGRFGYAGIRGSTSRGGARALLEAVQALSHGVDIAITPDGPRGPRHSFAPGAMLVAFRAGAAVVPIVSHVDRAWRLRSWDGFVIPKPFARVTVVYGTPERIVGTDARRAAEQSVRFAERMQAESARAMTLATAVWSEPLAPLPPVGT